MNITKIDMSRKKSLKTLVEDFLERDYGELVNVYDGQNRKAFADFSNTFQLLCDPTDDANDLSPEKLRDAILEWHELLRPLWEKIRKAYIDYRINILPESEKQEKMIAAVNDPSSPLSQYKDGFSDYTLSSDEKTYAIKLKRSPITINLTFDSGKFSISPKGIGVVDNLLLQLKDAPIEIFSICEHCGKILIVTRRGKRYHSGCASKANQKDRWKTNPEGCRNKERQRYQQRVIRLRGETHGEKNEPSKDKA